MPTIIIFAIIVLLIALSIRYTRHHGACASNCTSCGKTCSSHKKGGLVDRYRSDHPKTDCSC